MGPTKIDKNNIYKSAKDVPQGKLPALRKLTYGVGHVFNDLCAGMFFSYLILFFTKVVLLDNLYAGLLILIGQTVDAISTPIVGFLCDKTRVRYGGKKVWHLVGTILIGLSWFFVWYECLPCRLASSSVHNGTDTGVSQIGLIFNYGVFLVIFTFSWGCVQISHLSLIPELTPKRNERVTLYSIRYAFTVLSNITVYLTVLLLLEFSNRNSSNEEMTSVSNNTGSKNETEPDSQEITSADLWIFSGTALGVIFVGVSTSTIFQVGTKEPYINLKERESKTNKAKMTKWYLWFTKPQFYLIAVIYMCTRIMNNISQAYIPFFLLDSLHLPKESVAIGPLLFFISGFFMNTLMRFLNKFIGNYKVYSLGVAMIASGLLWFWSTYEYEDPLSVYGGIVLVGAGGATVLITSLSMIADLIGTNTSSSAFVYGAMGFTDKFSGGAVILTIQAFHPCKDNQCFGEEALFYRNILLFVPGAAALLSFTSLLALVVVTKWKDLFVLHLCPSCLQVTHELYAEMENPENENALHQTSPNSESQVENPPASRIRRVSVVLNHIELDDL